MIPLNGQVVDIPDTKHDPFELLKNWMNIRSFDPRLSSILRVGVKLTFLGFVHMKYLMKFVKNLYIISDVHTFFFFIFTHLKNS